MGRKRKYVRFPCERRVPHVPIDILEDVLRRVKVVTETDVRNLCRWRSVSRTFRDLIDRMVLVTDFLYGTFARGTETYRSEKGSNSVMYIVAFNDHPASVLLDGRVMWKFPNLVGIHGWVNADANFSPLFRLKLRSVSLSTSSRVWSGWSRSYGGRTSLEQFLVDAARRGDFQFRYRFVDARVRFERKVEATWLFENDSIYVRGNIDTGNELPVDVFSPPFAFSKFHTDTPFHRYWFNQNFLMHGNTTYIHNHESCMPENSGAALLVRERRWSGENLVEVRHDMPDRFSPTRYDPMNARPRKPEGHDRSDDEDGFVDDPLLRRLSALDWRDYV